MGRRYSKEQVRRPAKANIKNKFQSSRKGLNYEQKDYNNISGGFLFLWSIFTRQHSSCYSRKF